MLCFVTHWATHFVTVVSMYPYHSSIPKGCNGLARHRCDNWFFTSTWLDHGASRYWIRHNSMYFGWDKHLKLMICVEVPCPPWSGWAPCNQQKPSEEKKCKVRGYFCWAHVDCNSDLLATFLPFAFLGQWVRIENVCGKLCWVPSMHIQSQHYPFSRNTGQRLLIHNRNQVTESSGWMGSWVPS